MEAHRGRVEKRPSKGLHRLLLRVLSEARSGLPGSPSPPLPGNSPGTPEPP